jgi:peptidoglycan/xylan/chitin deacetylase (PgdA/CDA1 family)
MDTIALMYHALGSGEGMTADPHYTVETTRFGEQLALCQQLGGAAIHTPDWLSGRRGVILTFDDGQLSDYTVAFPTLKAAGAAADFFVNPRQVGTPGYATWAQLREMADGGMSIQSHGLDHRYFLTELSPYHLREDLKRARQEIEQRTGHPCTLLAPPGGRSPANLERIALACGYSHVLNSRPGRIVWGQSQTMCRVAVTSQLQLPSLEGWLRGGSALLAARVRYSVLDFAKRALGDTRYQRVRERLLGTDDAN